MDAKQVWRAALGELQVSLSPANYETWVRDTQLIDVDDQKFKIAVPNGFAKDWLDTPPLTRVDLDTERKHLAELNLKLQIIAT